MRKSTHSFEYRQLLQRLSEIRTAAGLSQRQVATRLRLPHSWVAKVETGERRIDLIEFGWFCEACGLDAGVAAQDLFANVKGRTESRTSTRPASSSRGRQGRARL
jgi:transcriptional regulator with XRE-family HTH domain